MVMLISTGYVLDARKLRTDIDWSIKELAKFRDARGKFERQAAGHHYGDNLEESDPNPVNYMELADTIYLQQLASSSPQISASTPHKSLKSAAADIVLVVNHILRSQNFKGTLREVVHDGLFGMGIVKIDRVPDSHVDIEDERIETGKTTITPVDLDDWVQDMKAKRWDQQGYRGHRYWVPLDEVRSDPRNNPDVAAKLQPSDRDENLTGGERGVEEMSRSGTSEEGDFEKLVELWDIYLPRQRLLVTLTTSPDLEPLRVIQWTGPPHGPFRRIGFRHVANNAMPVPPASYWYSMHVIGNNVFNKLADQALRQKTVLPVPMRQLKDGERTIETTDGEAFGVEYATGTLKEVSYGGISQVSMAFMLTLNDLQSRHAGNLDLLGGLSPQSDTVGQDKMLSDQATGRIRDMQDQVLEFVRGVAMDVAWHLWNESAVATFQVEKSTPGSLAPLSIEWSTANRVGNFLDYNFDVDPFSARSQSPSDRLQTLTMVFERFVLPAMQTGVQPDMEAILRLVGKYADFQEISDIIQFATPSFEEMRGPVTGEARQSPVTTRTNIRVNRGGATSAGKNKAMVSTLLGAGVQSKETDMIGRPVG